MDVRPSNPKPHRTVLSTVRVRLFLAGFLVSGTAAAATAQPLPGQPRRAAVLLAPQPLGPEDTPVVARGAIDDLPAPVIGSTPATRPGSSAAPTGLPTWLNGLDKNVIPAGVTTPPVAGAGWSPPLLTPPAAAPRPPEPTAAKGTDRWKGFIGWEQPGVDPRTTVDPNAPLRGVAANGAPVLAGPPAYRWFGYGSVTPGANTYAPTGQSPRASANWYSITGATPGAFPVPVMNPYRPAPGSEPPAYVAAPPALPPVGSGRPNGFVMSEPVVPGMSPGRPVQLPPAVPSSRFNPPPAPVATPKPDPIAPGGQSLRPILTPGPLLAHVSVPSEPEPKPSNSTLPAAGIPALVLPPMPLSAAPLSSVAVSAPATIGPPTETVRPEPEVKLPPPAPPAAVPLLPLPGPAPVAISPRLLRPLEPESPRSTPAVVAPPLVPAPTSGPAPVAAEPTRLPTLPALESKPTVGVPPPLTTPAVVRPPASPVVPAPPTAADAVQWRTNPDRVVPVPPGTWVPAKGTPRTAEPPAEDAPEPETTNTTQPRKVARGQVGDNDRQPDPVVALIHTLCRGRAEDVDVRWVGSKKLTVCFGVRSSAEATALVKDISGRRELAAFQIDFAVFVK